MNCDHNFEGGSTLPESFASPSPADTSITNKRKSGRRSWFTPSKQIRLEIAVDPREQQQQQSKASAAEEIEILSLTHFARPPKIDFGTVRVGKRCVRTLCAHNPHDYVQQVVLEKFPFHKDFSIDLTEFFVNPGENQMIELVWAPKEEGNQRQMMMFYVEGVIRLQAFLIGKAELPPNPKKRKTWKPPHITAPLTTLQPSASVRSKQLQATKNLKQNGTSKNKSNIGDKGIKSTSSFKTSTRALKKSTRPSIIEDKENTPPQHVVADYEDDGELNRSNLQRSLTYSKLNQSFSPSPTLSRTSGPNSRRGSDDTRRTSKESIFSVYEDCLQTLSRRPSYESVISVYEDCQAPNSRRPSEEALSPSELTSRRKSGTIKRMSKESAISEYEDASEFLSSDGGSLCEDSLIVPQPEKTPNKSGFSRDILVESYEVVEQVEEQIITEEVMVTETKVMSDSYEITTDVDVEVVKSTDTKYHEQIIKETFVHVDGSPQRYFPGVYSGERKYFPSIEEDNIEHRTETSKETADYVNIKRETMIIRDKSNYEGFPRQPELSSPTHSAPLWATQTPSKLQQPEHVTGEPRKSFSPLQTRFSPQSPQSDPNQDPNISRRETVTKACPSPALVACHSRLVQAGHSGCVDEVDNSTPMLRLSDLRKSPRSSTPIPSRNFRHVGAKQTTTPGPSWALEHLGEPTCSPVRRIEDDGHPTSPRRALFAKIAEPDARRISTLTVTKSKDGSRESPVIDPATVTKSKSAVAQYRTSDLSPKHFERTIDQTNNAEVSRANNNPVENGRRLSSLTVTKVFPSRSVSDLPECRDTETRDTVQAVGKDVDDEDNSPFTTATNSSFSKSINSRTRSGGKKKRRSSGKKRRLSSAGRRRSETVTKSRSSLSPPSDRSGRKRLSSKKLFSPPPQDQVQVMDESIAPFSPSPQKRLSAIGAAKLAARMKQEHESSLDFPIHHSKVTANLINHRRSSMGIKREKSMQTNTMRRSVDSYNKNTLDTSKQAKRRSFGNKTLPTNLNRPVTKPERKQVVADTTTGLKLNRTQQLRRNAAKSAMNTNQPSKPSSRRESNACSSNNRASQNEISSTKSTTNRTRLASGVKGLAKSKLTLIKNKLSTSTALPKHPMPFASKNVYYDERWMEKQERGFVKWLNFILTPPDEYIEATKPQKVKETVHKLLVDAGKLCMDAKSDPKLAPTKEVISFRTYAAHRRLNRLRRNACKMFQTEQNAKIIKKLEIEIETRHLAVREDRKVHADLGIKQKLLDMMLSYNPLWLRIGLETVFGEILPVQSNVDIIGISRFIVTRLLGSPDISQAYSHPTVPHLYGPGYNDAIAQHVLKKFLLLVYFLDQAKMARLIDHDPCLFCKDAEFKSSRDLLLVFARDYLRGEGDLTRHLSYMGYTVKYTQTALEEFDYAVACLATDLRDGVRLTRVIEMLREKWELSKQMRVPAISRLQKIHNMDVVFKTLIQHGLELTTSKGGTVTSRDIVDGHRERTLLLLWNIIFKFQVECMFNEEQLQDEIKFLQTNLRLQKQYEDLLQDLDSSLSMLGLPRDRRESIETNVYFKSPVLCLLLRWAQAVCSYYGMRVENFTVSFSDGRALCYLLHHYHPSLLKLEDISTETTLTYDEKKTVNTPGSSGDDSFSYNWTTTFSPSTGKSGVFETLLANEKSNFKLLYEKVSELGGIPVMVRCADMSSTIPDEKVVITYVSYLCARLLDIRHETRAARTIQAAWRKYRIGKTKQEVEKHREELEHERLVNAATRIQAWWRARSDRNSFVKQRKACVTIQRFWVARQLTRRAVKEYRDIKEATETIQIVVRKWLLRKRIIRRKAVATIARYWRGHSARKLAKRKLCAIVKLQSLVRAYQVREYFLRQRSAAIKIQRAFRYFQNKKLDKENWQKRTTAAVTIQKYVRSYRQRREFLRCRAASVKIQASWRAYSSYQKFIRMKYAAILIQGQYRAHLLSLKDRRTYHSIRAATLVIQTHARRWLATKHVRRLQAARSIQATFRCYQQRKKYLQLRDATLLLQSKVKMMAQRKRYRQLCSAALILQQRFRAQREANKQQKYYQNLRNAVIIIQATYRGNRDRQYVQQIRATIAIQSALRMYTEQRNYVQKLNAVIVMQKNIRMYLVRQNYIRQKVAATLIQNHYRFHLLRKQIETDFQRMKRAAHWIQRWYRRASARKYFLKCRYSAIKIQAWWRMKRQRNTYVQTQGAVQTIQKHWRRCLLARQERHELQQRTCASLIIQSCWRRYKARATYMHKRRSVLTIQKYARMCIAKKRYRNKLQALLTLQKYVRAWWLGRQQWENYHIQRGACIVIQTKFRCWLAERAYQEVRSSAVLVQSCVRMHQARRRYQETRNAAITIQSRWRATLSARTQRMHYTLQRVAAIILQAMYRGHQCRKAFRQKRRAIIVIQSSIRCYQQRCLYLKQKSAAEKIQNWYRNWQITMDVKKEFVQKREAAVVIQSYTRTYLQRLKYRHSIRSVVKIQSFVRMLKAKRQFERTRHVIISLQQKWRRTLATRRIRSNFLRTKNAAITIQAAYKAYVQRQHFLITKRGITKLQALARMRATRTQYLQKVSAIRVLQQRWRCTLTTRRIRNDFLSMKNAAIKIQATYKAHVTRKQFLTTKRGITKLQALARMRTTRTQYLHKLSAIRVLQTRTRAYLVGQKTRKEYYDRREAEVKAAVRIQTFYRSYVQRSRFLTSVRKIVKVQSVVRMWRAQRLLQQLKRERSAAICIQTYYRAYRLGSETRRRFIVQKAAALILQTYYRSYRCRKTLRVARHAATVIQASCRMFAAKRHYQTTLRSVVTIQRWYRQKKMAESQRQEFLEKKSAITTIQSWYRAYRCRQHIRRLNVAATLIQSYFRMYRVRGTFSKHKHTVIRIQKWYRAVYLAKRQREQYARTKTAVLTIQSWYRGTRCRKLLATKQKACVVIQSSLKGYLERRKFLRQKHAANTIRAHWKNYTLTKVVRSKYLQQKNAAIVLQSFVRQIIAEKRYQLLRHSVVKVQSLVRMQRAMKDTKRKYEAIITIQRKWRATIRARNERTEFEQLRKATIKVQAIVRMCLARRRFQIVKKGFIVLQATHRMRSQRQRFVQQKAAILVIQDNIRSYLAVQRIRRAYHTKKIAVVTIQKHWRGYKSRLLVQQTRAAICIQSLYRCYNERKRYQKTLEHVVKLQAHIRGCITRMKYAQVERQWQAVICIQRCVRRYLAKLALKRQQQIRQQHLVKVVSTTKYCLKVIRIQRCVRRYLSIKRAEEQMASVVIIQRWVRRRLERRKFLKVRRSVHILQKVFRGWYARKYVQNMHGSATTIQAAWRGYRVRKANKSKKLKAVRQRVQDANAAATEDKKLCNRTSSALDFLLNYRQLAFILEALINLDAVTRLSPECCKQMVEGHALPVIFQLIRSCNRSIPHMEIIKYSVSVLLNVAKYEKTAGAVFDVENSVDTLVEVMTHFREKGAVFTKSCTLLGILCYNAARKQEVRAMTKVVDKIQSIHKIVSRKHTMEEKRQLVKTKMAASQSFSSQSFCGSLPGLRQQKPHQIRPEWVLRRNSIHVIEDPMKAISFVMNCLNLTSK